MSNQKNTALQPNKTTTKPAPSPPLILKFLGFAFNICGKSAPKITGCIAYKLWILPPRFKTTNSELPALNSAEIIKQDINGYEITTFGWGSQGLPYY